MIEDNRKSPTRLPASLTGALLTLAAAFDMAILRAAEAKGWKERG